MSVSINLSSTSVKERVKSAILSGIAPAEAVRAVVAEIQAEEALRSASKAATMAIHAYKRELGLQVNAPELLIEGVKAYYDKRAFERAEYRKQGRELLGLKSKALEEYISANVSSYPSPLIFRLAMAWKHDAFNPISCYINPANIDKALADLDK